MEERPESGYQPQGIQYAAVEGIQLPEENPDERRDDDSPQPVELPEVQTLEGAVADPVDMFNPGDDWFCPST
ncbi:hypothetical protein ACFL1B_04180 [Nanoarchaeota archaeon]